MNTKNKALNKKEGPFTGEYTVCIGSAQYPEYSEIYKKFPNQRYHGFKVIYDPGDIGDTICDMGFKKAEYGYLTRILKKRIERGEIYDLNNLGQIQDPLMATYIELRGTEEDFQKWIKYLGKYILDKAPKVSGDDDFFDYYPDLMDVFAQVCYAFGKNDYCLNMLNTPTMHKHYWNRGADFSQAEFDPEDVIY
tara:strand:+ start:93 stop:671 length:579 start_codon:yes stop_codon:yes gene_type:complete